MWSVKSFVVVTTPSGSAKDSTLWSNFKPQRINMKSSLSIALCLLLVAVGCSASLSHEDLDFQPFVRLQQKSMRSLIDAHSASDDTDLINRCFNDYLDDQNSVLINYNKQYSGCISTAQSSKNALTAQSSAQRNDLLDRSDGMCVSLNSCNHIIDGLAFFDCYSDAVGNPIGCKTGG